MRPVERVLLLGAAALLLPASAEAEGIDGSVPLVCDLTGAALKVFPEEA